MTFSHLTDEQLAAHLAGDGSTGEDHLAACAACQAEIAHMRTALQVFNQASLDWCEHLPRVYRPKPSWRPTAVWAAVCMAVLAVVLLAGILYRPRQLRVATSSSGDSNTAGLSQDNALLSAIDRELDSTELSPQKMYGAQ